MARDSRYETAKRLALGALKKGFHLGGHVTRSREELHERNQHTPKAQPETRLRHNAKAPTKPTR